MPLLKPRLSSRLSVALTAEPVRGKAVPCNLSVYIITVFKIAERELTDSVEQKEKEKVEEKAWRRREKHAVEGSV